MVRWLLCKKILLNFFILGFVWRQYLKMYTTIVLFCSIYDTKKILILILQRNVYPDVFTSAMSKSTQFGQSEHGRRFYCCLIGPVQALWH